MFVNWLLTVFPVELRGGWDRLRPQVLLWATVALLSALLAGLSESTHGRPPATLLILQIVGPLLVTFLVAATLDAGERGQVWDTAEMASLLAARGLPLFGFAVVATLFTRIPQSVALYAADALLRETPFGHATAAAFSIVIYISLLARVCFVPFLVVLQRPSQLRPQLLPGGWLALPSRLVWPLIASDRMSEGRRWRIAPYLILPYLATLAVRLMPDGPAQLGALALGELFKLACLAVLFGYFVESRPIAISDQPEDH